MKRYLSIGVLFKSLSFSFLQNHRLHKAVPVDGSDLPLQASPFLSSRIITFMKPYLSMGVTFLYKPLLFFPPETSTSRSRICRWEWPSFTSLFFSFLQNHWLHEAVLVDGSDLPLQASRSAGIDVGLPAARRLRDRTLALGRSLLHHHRYCAHVSPGRHGKQLANLYDHEDCKFRMYTALSQYRSLKISAKSLQ